MKLHFTKILYTCLLLTVIAITGCNKSSDDNGTLGSISSYVGVGPLTPTTAQIYSVYNPNGNITVSAVGVCWSATNQTPTLSDSKTSNSKDSITFKSNISGLTANTTYYARGYVTDAAGTAYGNVITFKTPTTSFAVTATVSTFAGSGTAGLVNATGANAQFYNPQGICTDAAGNMYVADAVNSVIRKITPAGVVTTLAGTGTSGYTDGAGNVAQFYYPAGVAVDAAGNVYVADMGNNMIRKVTSAGVVSTLAGRFSGGYLDATGTTAAFKSPTGVAVDATGNVFVADAGNNCIRKITSAGVVTTFAGNVSKGQVDATGTAAYFNAPNSLAFDAAGNLYVADSGNFSVRKITSAGVVTTIAGNYILKTTVFTPTGICVDGTGNIFIADANGQIFEITATTNIIRALAGSTTTTGLVNGTNANAAFNSPRSLTTDATGNIFVADMYNNVIRKIVLTTTP